MCIRDSNDARPDWSLKVSGTASDSFLISNSSSADGTIQGTALSIATAGGVGLGKFGATDALEINSLNSATAALVIANVTDGMSMRMKSESASGSIGTITNDKLGFMTNATTRGAFDTSGQFGIGTDAPGALLDVRGSVIFNEAGAAVDVRMEGDTEANLFFLDGSTDRIGIGTATPAVGLDVDFGGDGTGVLMCVNGCICAVGYLGEKQGHTVECSGVALTQRTGLNFVVTDVGTVTDDSSNDATVVCINGANACIPFLLCDGSTSDPISLAGGSIGNALSNDSNPTLGGLMCGAGENICAVCCICITGCYFGDGSQLGGGVVIPSVISEDCTVIGCNAGGNVAAGATNVVIYGGSAGYNVTTADNIVVIGTDAALCMTTATDSVFIGTSTARCVLTCAGNMAIGAWSLYNECAGSYNTVVGTCAGLTQKGATTNTFVGALAGALNAAGSGNVFIGYKAGCANTSGSCCLVIGNGTCDLITGDFNGGSVGFASIISSGTSVFCNTITVGVNDTGHDVKFFGASSGAFMHYDESADTLDVRGATAAGPGVLKLTTGELTNVDGGILGRVEFQAPLDSAGTDAILVAASIWAEADATFSASVNTTDMVFATATTATAAEQMRLTSGGCLGIATTAPASLLDVRGTVQVGVNDTGHDVTFFGATSGCKFLWDEDADKLIVCAEAITTGASVLCNTLTVGVNDTGHDVKFFGATAGCYFLWDEDVNTLEVCGTDIKLNGSSVTNPTSVDNIQGYINGGTLKWEVASGTTWSFGWWQSSNGQWWLLGNTAEVDTFTRAQAEFYIPTGDIADVPSS